ncbi:MAG: RsbRD N-terminal domain-containing protein, partial [Desulfobacterales bacterium]|nr:RsbRD N-terminal domain-containing protein [Desulfobacterales bacterium]
MLESLLLQRSSSVLDKWFDAIVGTYPPDTKRFLKKQKDRFANPVGTTLFKEMESLYQELLRGEDRKNSFAILDRIIRIRAVQDFSP